MKLLAPCTAIVFLLSSAALPAAETATTMTATTGTWKADGVVADREIHMTCSIVEADMKLTGTCKGLEADPKEHPISGTVKDDQVAWAFYIDYEGTPLTLTFSGKLSSDGGKITGQIMVDPMNLDGTFSATKQPAA